MPQLATVAAIALAIFLTLLLVQHGRVLRNRRQRAEDQQRYSLRARRFHVCVLFKVPSGHRIDETARHFVHQILGGGDVALIYAGQVAFSIDSSQLGPARWDGLLLFELRSRDRFSAAYTERFRRARNLFEESYLFGMQRLGPMRTLTPLSQLWLMTRGLLRGRFRDEALVELPELLALPEHDAIRGYLRRLHAVHEISRDALVVYNLASRRRASAALPSPDLTENLLGRLARKAMGPLHVGRFARIEHNAVFDTVYVVQYPSARYFGELLGSQYHDTITNHPQLADSLIIPTVPITSRL